MHRRRRSAPADWLGVFGAAAFSLVVSLVLPAHAAEPDWLKLQTPRFGVVSQLGPESTERWAREFDRFIEAIQQLFGANDLTLPPLTIVLFENARAFILSNIADRGPRFQPLLSAGVGRRSLFAVR
jgi:hypothetical protein